MERGLLLASKINSVFFIIFEISLVIIKPNTWNIKTSHETIWNEIHEQYNA